MLKLIQDALGHQDIYYLKHLCRCDKRTQEKEFAGLDMYFMQGQ